MSDDPKAPARATDADDRASEAPHDASAAPEKADQPRDSKLDQGRQPPDTTHADTTDMNAVGDDGQVFGG